jgi:hypothetical protein
MKRRASTRAVGASFAIAATLIAALVLSIGGATTRSQAAKPAERVRAVVKGNVGSDVRFVGELARSGATRWCGHLEVRVRDRSSGSLQGEYGYDSARKCGTISRESVVILTLACSRAIGAAAVLRGRPVLRAKLADGRTKAVPVRRIRDRSSGTFYAIAFTARQLPATIRIVGGPIVADVPAIKKVC